MLADKFQLKLSFWVEFTVALVKFTSAFVLLSHQAAFFANGKFAEYYIFLYLTANIMIKTLSLFTALWDSLWIQLQLIWTWMIA